MTGAEFWSAVGLLAVGFGAGFFYRGWCELRGGFW